MAADLPSYEKHVLRAAKAGVGILVAGSNGEGIHLTHAERSTLVKTARSALDTAGFTDVPIIAPEDLVAAAFPAVPFEGLPPALDAESAVSRGAAGLGGRFWDASNIYNHDFSSDTGFRSLNAVCAPETARTVTQRQNRVEGHCRSAQTRYWECFEQEECRQVRCGGVE